jgi:phosphohistidine phosphatase SixA
MPRMIRVLALLRHGVSDGSGADAALLPEGAALLRRLGAMLAAEGWMPAAILTSPYRRARESAAVLAGALGCIAPVVALEALVPEADSIDALEAIDAAAPIASPVLVVGHMPLVGRIVLELTGEDPGFSPGTFVELAREGSDAARLLRRVGPRDLAGV